MDFPDARATDSTDAYATHLAPAADWMRRASYGRSRLALSSLHRWIRMPADSTSYGFERDLTFEAHEKYLRDAITAADPHADLSRYDMVYVVPTKAAAAITFSPTYLYDPATTPPTGCTQLDLAAYAPGRTFTDPDTGVRIDVLTGNKGGDTVRLSKG